MFNDPYNQFFTTSGLYTPSVFSILLNHEVARSKRYPSPLSILQFSTCQPAPLSEEIRETIEKMVAQVLKTKLRQTDISSQSKDGYLVLFTNTDGTGANIATNRLLENFLVPILNNQNKPVEVGFCAGLVSHPGGPQVSADHLLKQATFVHQEARTKGAGALVFASL